MRQTVGGFKLNNMLYILCWKYWRQAPQNVMWYICRLQFALKPPFHFGCSFIVGLPQHWIMRELEEEECVCPICNKQYKNRNTLKSHMIQDCQRKELLKCTMCEYKCKRNYHMKVHMNLKHGIVFKIKRRRAKWNLWFL